MLAATAALLSEVVPQLDNLTDRGRPQHHAAAVAGARVVPNAPTRARPVVKAIIHAQTGAPVLSIAALRGLQLSPSEPLVPIGPPIAGPGYTSQRVAYRSQGLRVTATVLRPDSRGRHRLVIALHGYSSPATYANGGDAMSLAIPLAGHGVLVGIPDYRGLGGGDPDPRTEPLPIASAIDSLNLLELLLADREVDPAHVGLIAHSMGGNVAEVMLASHPGIRTAVLYAPSESQYSVLYLRRPSYFRGRPGIGTPEQDPALFAAMSPGLNFGGLHCRILLQQGTADPVVPAGASVIAARELSAAGATVELRMVHGATHDLDSPVWATPLAEGTSFLLQNL
jgi:dipeptidyl aminopeptidase/acylaminoacyl peptidase